ncbi:MAG: GspE/PulE family protein [bacterium]
MSIDAVTKELGHNGDVSIIALVGGLIERARSLNASDIHIDPNHAGLRVRLRVDGVLQDAYTFPHTISSEVISRIKVLASLRTDEHQATQDGRFRLPFAKGDFVDVRVSIAPTYHGENAVLRLLSDTAENFTLEMLGFSGTDQEKILHAIRKPSGMVLATGPTGSGKTTTLYTLLKLLNSKEISIVTIEDPIEYAVEGVEQIQVNPRAGLTFANGLRTILRQDPNIIMVGEIRDTETASIAINTALTGHLLLSTLHTNDAATTLPRLLDMDIEAFLVASTVSVAIAQRLVRKICLTCREEVAVTQGYVESLQSMAFKNKVHAGDVVYRGAGCAACNNSGYSGRVCINEVLVADDEMREAILQKVSSSELKKVAIKNGMTTMLEDGFAKVRAGITTFEEVLRVIYE